MTILTWLAVSSLVWGAVLWLAAFLLQRSGDVSGRARQWIWRGATALLIAPWIAAPLVSAFGLGLAPRETPVAEPVFTTTLPMVEFTGEGMGSALPDPVVTTADLDLAQIFLIVVAVGWIARFVSAQLAARSLFGIVNMSRPAESGAAMQSLKVWSQRLGLRRAPRLLVTEASVSPFSFGVLRQTVCIPEGLEGRLRREALDLVIGHECLHVARGDGWRRPLERIAADVFWFNPFAWLMRRELDMARELACDEGVVQLSDARHAYARTLRDVAGFSTGLSLAAPAASMSLAGGGRSLMLRVTRTLALAKRKPARAAMIAACVAGLIAVPIAVAQVALAVPRAPEALEALEPLEALAAPEAPEPLEPLAALEAPEAPETPEPPVVEQQVYVSPDGMVRASFPARVVWIGGDATNGYAVKLVQAANASTTGMCTAELEGLGALKVAKEQVVAEGAVIALRGDHKRVSFQVSCSDEDGDQIAPVAPVPPVPAVAPTAPTPLAPPAPLSPSGQVAPVTPMTPVTPRPLATPPTPLTAPAALEPLPIRAMFPARVVSVDPVGNGSTASVKILQTSAGTAIPLDANPCVIVYAEVAGTRVSTGQNIPEGTLIGISVPANPRVATTCTTAPMQFSVMQVTPATNATPVIRKMAPFVVPGATSSVLDGAHEITWGYGYKPDPFEPSKIAFHEGVDLKAPWGALVHTPATGVVLFAGTRGSYGRMVEIQYGENITAGFAHLNSISVKAGDSLEAGDEVGTVGSTGRSSGAHLHFEVFFNGKSYDPQSIEGLKLAGG